MSVHQEPIYRPLARRCRMVAAAIVASVWVGKSGEDVEARIASLPTHQQTFAVFGVLGFLFLVSLFAAQFGFIGLALLLAAVVLILR